jgi:hypothetical protein
MEKTYAKGIFIKSVETKFGEILKVSFKIEDFAKFVKQHKNDKGYLNLDIMPRKEVGKYGDTHYAILNTYVKENKSPDEILTEPEDSSLPF